MEEVFSLVLNVCKSAPFAQQITLGILKLCPEIIPLFREYVIVSDQALNIFQRAPELERKRFEFILVHPELVPAGFERSGGAEPIVGVFYIEGIHGHVC
ncbi:hypothetical protein V5O39_10455 [Pseudomonas parakoreensis]